MQDRVVMASKFKEQCLALLDEVERTKVPVLVTKHGRPVARLVPLEAADRARPIRGSVRLLSKDDSAYFTASPAWEAEGGTAGR